MGDSIGTWLQKSLVTRSRFKGGRALRSYQVKGVNWILSQYELGVGGIMAGVQVSLLVLCLRSRVLVSAAEGLT